jgi:hypothetical protein
MTAVGRASPRPEEGDRETGAVSEPPAQGVATVVLPPVAGVAGPLLGHLPLGLFAVAARAGGLAGLRIRTIRMAGQVRAGTLDLYRPRTFRALLQHLDRAECDGDGQDWPAVTYRVGVTAPADQADAPLALDVTAGTDGLRCALRYNPVAQRPAWAGWLVTSMLAVGVRVSEDLDGGLADLAAELGTAPPAGHGPDAGNRPVTGADQERLRRRPDLPTPLVAPRTALERQLVELWRQILGLAELGVDDDFFEVGGHSLMAAELVRRMQDSFGTDLAVEALYLQPTVAAVAAQIKASRDHRSLAET